jgi:hypothetical protein
MDIINKIPKDIKKINKILKKEGFDPIVVGVEALVQCHLPTKDAILLANWQELSGLKFILNASHIPTKWGSLDSAPFALATAKDNNIPPFLFQYEGMCETKNDVKSNFDLMTNAIRWFEFNKENAQKIKEKRRNFIDKVLLTLDIKDFIFELAHIKPQHISAYQLYHFAIANYWSRKNHHAKNPFLAGYYAIRQKIFFKPWLIIIKVGREGYQFIYGRNQQQLIKYLLHSEYLKDISLQCHFNFDLALGWDKVLRKQIALGQKIPDSILESLYDYEEMTQEKLKQKRLTHHFITKYLGPKDDQRLDQSLQ